VSEKLLSLLQFLCVECLVCGMVQPRPAAVVEGNVCGNGNMLCLSDLGPQLRAVFLFVDCRWRCLQ